MPIVMTDKERLLALHRKLYLLESPEKKISGNTRTELYQMLKKRWCELSGEEQGYISQFILDEDLKNAAGVVEECRKQNIKIVSWFDPDYPCRTISSPPPIIYIRGFLADPLSNPYIAIVGSRKATEYGREMTKKIVRGLVPYSTTIISGLAYGIDAEAHKSALEHNLPTVAVMGCGIDRIYPIGNLGLAKDILNQNGAIISEFPWGTPPLKHNFPLRNRLISGLSRATAVVEAEIKSGSLISAKWAADQGKEVFAVPGNVGRVLSSGTNLLIKDGATLLENASDIVCGLKLQKREINSEFEKNSGHAEPEDVIKSAVIDFVRGGGDNIDKLVEKTGLSVGKLLPLITEIELTNADISD